MVYVLKGILGRVIGGMTWYMLYNKGVGWLWLWKKKRKQKKKHKIEWRKKQQLATREWEWVHLTSERRQRW